jgi:hypothetical protein
MQKHEEEVAAIKAQADKIVDSLTLPALASEGAPITALGLAAAKAEATKRLTQKFEGTSPHVHYEPPCSVRTNPEAATEAERWEVKRRPHAPHEVRVDNIVWIPYTHGGPRIQACYYFEWDGGE